MMKKIIFICEGPTEQFFCKEILFDHFRSLDIEIEFPLIIHSNGGIVKWEHIKTQIENHSTTEPDAVITTLIDYYGIEHHHQFPNWTEAEAESNKSVRMTILEDGMLGDVSNSIKFIPYIQLHEFEALVFSDYIAFEEYYDASEANFANLKTICDEYPNPEDINNSTATAPSKRLISNIPRYLKTIDGIELLKNIGLHQIKAKCPRFRIWMEKMEAI